MSYTHYKAEDFAADDYFIRWVKTPDAETEAFWQEWLSKHPQKRETLQEAKELVLLMELKDNFPMEEQVNRMRQHIYSRTRRTDPVTDMLPLIRQKANTWYQSWLKVAAVFLSLLVASYIIWYTIQQFGITEHRTTYGQIQKVQLPDGSTVTLNANSMLSYKKSTWNKAQDREVWLEGEAFFDVKHLKSHNKFLVHTTDKLTVEVLGTTFNVFERKSGTRVVLQSGKVKLSIRQGQKQDQVLMQPGEQVELQEKTGSYAKRTVNARQALAWTEHKMYFDNTTLAEVVSVLEDNFGLEVHVSGKALLQKKLVGSAPTQDVDIFLAALSKSFSLKINRNGNEVSITSLKLGNLIK